MKHAESKDCPCHPVIESFRGPDPLQTMLENIAGVPCRFCFGRGNPDGPCPECGKPVKD
jgi:hypothetical protein